MTNLTTESAFVFTVSDVAAQSGVAASAVRFYEKHGIVTSMRTGGNQRRFTGHAACRVKVARVAQRIGYSIAQIAALLECLPPDPQLEDWEHLHTVMIAEAERRVADVNAQLTILKSGAKFCELPDTPTLS